MRYSWRFGSASRINPSWFTPTREVNSRAMNCKGFLKDHNLVASMSRRGNCHDNAVVESFFELLKRERMKRRTYLDREQARRDVFDYKEMFYNPIRRHSHNDGLSPVKYEQQFNQRLASV